MGLTGCDILYVSYAVQIGHMLVNWSMVRLPPCLAVVGGGGGGSQVYRNTVLSLLDHIQGG